MITFWSAQQAPASTGVPGSTPCGAAPVATGGEESGPGPEESLSDHSHASSEGEAGAALRAAGEAQRESDEEDEMSESSERGEGMREEPASHAQPAGDRTLDAWLRVPGAIGTFD